MKKARSSPGFFISDTTSKYTDASLGLASSSLFYKQQMPRTLVAGHLNSLSEKIMITKV